MPGELGPRIVRPCHRHREAGEHVVRRRGDELAEPRGELVGPADRVRGQALDDLRADRVQRELERGDDAEVRSGAPDPPEQVGVLVLAGPDLPAVRRQELDPTHVVDAEAVLPLEPAHPASEGESAHAGVRDHADRAGQPEPLGLAVELAEERAAEYRGRAGLRIDRDPANRGQVDDDPVVARGLPAHAVPAAPHRDHQVLLPAETDGRGHVLDTGRPDHHGRVAIHGGVPHDPGRVVPLVAGQHDLAPKSLAERGHGSRRKGPGHAAHRTIRDRLSGAMRRGPCRPTPPRPSARTPPWRTRGAR